MAFYIAHGNMKWRKTKGESDMGCNRQISRLG